MLPRALLTQAKYSGIRFCCLIILLAGCLKAQNPSFNFQHLGSEEGLSNANIFNVEQGHNRLMYITSQNGIYTYDGYVFTKLGVDSLKNNVLVNTSVKDKSTLYMSLRDEGIAELDLRQRQFRLIPELRDADNNADQFIITEKFAYLLITGIKTVIVDRVKKQVLPDNEAKARKNLALCIYKTKKGRVLVGRTDGLYDVTDGTFRKHRLFVNTQVHAITEDEQGRMYVGGMDRMFIVKNDSIQQEIIPRYPSKSSTFQLDGFKSIKRIVVDRFLRIWFTSYPEENLFLYEKNTVYDVFSILGLPPTLIQALYRDSEENIWVGTVNDGIYVVQNSFFNSVTFTYNNKSLTVNKVFLQDNLLVAATNNGLFGLNLLGNKTRILSKPDEVFGEPITSISSIDQGIYYGKRSQFNMSPSIFLDGQNTYRFRPVIARLFYPISKENSVLADWEANILLMNSDGSRVQDTLISFSDYRISVNCMLKIGHLLYIGTSSGLYIYDFESDKYQHVIRSELNFNINDLARSGNKLYAAHESGITEIYSRQLIQEVGSFRLSTVKKILFHNDQVWLGTLDGIYICNPELAPLRIINKSTGLLSNSVNDLTIHRGQVAVATGRGISVASLGQIEKFASRLAPVEIAEVQSGGRKVMPDADAYRFGAEEDLVTVSLISPLFAKPNKQFYRWRLDEGEWKYFSNPSFELALPAGRHKVEISASVDNIEWSEPVNFETVKEEKLSETQLLYWLISIASVLVILVVSFFWVRRIKRKARRRLEEEQQVNLLKHQAMNALLSPHFIFNSLTSIQNYINTNNGLRASEYLAKFSRLIRMIIEKAAQSHITLHDELARLTYYLELEKERFKNKFEYVINIAENIDTREVLIPNMIIQPHVENCIIHGILPKHEPGLLTLGFTMQSAGRLVIVIEDNGIGLIRAAEHAKTGHKSLGTNTIRNILEINSKLSGKRQKVSMVDKSTMNATESGTIITIELEL